jgi:hypothetical protein
MLPSSGGVGCSRISESGDTRQPTPHTRESGQAQNEYTVQIVVNVILILAEKQFVLEYRSA